LRTHIVKFATIVLTLFSLLGCQIESHTKSDLEIIQERGVLRVGTLNNQLSYFIGPNGPAGLEFELAQLFADELGVKLEITPAYRLSGLFPALEAGEIDIIAAGLSQTPNRIKDFRAGPAYYYESQVVVYKKGQLRPRNIQQLIETEQTLTVVKDSHFEQTLTNLLHDYPELKFDTTDKADGNQLLRQVSAGERLYAMADLNELALIQRIYPDVAIAFELTEDQPISWFMRKANEESLTALVIEFFGKIKQSGQLDTLEEKYLGHIGSFDYVDTRAFVRALDSKLPEWESLFKKYSGEFDWRLIAALAYQESHWNPLAKSPTGVRGMMMLTLPTAKSVNVNNRLDPEQSVRGGVEYLRRIVARIPDSISEHEKIWFALASYNVGYGHMMDARRLTKKQGGNPDLWSDVKERLPLLRKKEFYSQTYYGFARGDEAKNYVENIRRYYQSIIGHVDKTQASISDIELDDFTVISAPISAATATTVSSAESAATGTSE
jgi:membrane-bound lytic murein transglycosylase F